ncbi:MAG: alpha/beta hydrolase [Myxococcales bacterium]
MIRLFVFLALFACTRGGPSGPDARLSRQIVFSPCRLRGIAFPTECGVLRVPEDRANPGDRRAGRTTEEQASPASPVAQASRSERTIDLRVALIPALARDPAPDPLFLLAGGPGQAATEALGTVVTALERVRRTRDLVLVDQRGTGSSGALECRLAAEDAPLQDLLSAEGFREDRILSCLHGYKADVRRYTTTIAMQDLDDVRRALGYETINLWGGSYGTRAALVYLREHGSHVRVAILDGVAPLSLRMPLYFARDAQRSLDLLFDACAADATCKAAFPDLRSRFGALLDRLASQPARVTVSDPITGRPTNVTIEHDAFVAMLRAVLYAPELASLLPLTIDRAAHGDFTPYVAQAATLQRGFSGAMSLGLLFSIVCAEDAPAIAEGEMEREARNTFLGASVGRVFERTCKIWPREELPKGYREPVRSDKPVLLLSGELDPVTPPSWAAEAAKTLPNSLQIVVPGVGHGATVVGCVPGIVARFLAEGSIANVDASCARVQSRPPFFVSFAGPSP